MSLGTSVEPHRPMLGTIGGDQGLAKPGLGLCQIQAPHPIGQHRAGEGIGGT
jgi:hypothetical protein